MSLLLGIIMTYIKENIITKFQKLFSQPRTPMAGNKLATLFVKKALYMGDLSPACKIFTGRPVIIIIIIIKKIIIIIIIIITIIIRQFYKELDQEEERCDDDQLVVEESK